MREEDELITDLAKMICDQSGLFHGLCRSCLRSGQSSCAGTLFKGAAERVVFEIEYRRAHKVRELKVEST